MGSTNDFLYLIRVFTYIKSFKRFLELNYNRILYKNQIGLWLILFKDPLKYWTYQLK